MFIVIDARMILPQMTGAGRYLLGLAGGLRQITPTDTFEIWLQSAIPANHPVWELASPTLRLRRLPLRHMELRQQWALPREIRRARPDLLHYPHFDLPWLVNSPVVATLYDLKYIARPDFFPQQGAAKRLVMRWMMASTARRARRIITISESTRQDLTRRLSVPLEKVRVVPLAVDTAYFAAIPQTEIQAIRQRYQLSAPYILFVGERRPHKNLPGLLEGFARFQKMAPQPCQLVIAGKAYADYQAPERLAEDLNLGNAVRFLDYVPDTDLPHLYRGAQAFALLSYYEGFGLPVLEAMACGTPVVAAASTSLPEVCGQAGLLVDPDQPEQIAQALHQVVTDGAQRQQIIAAGLERARQFTWEACARQTLVVYHEAIL